MDKRKGSIPVHRSCVRGLHMAVLAGLAWLGVCVGADPVTRPTTGQVEAAIRDLGDERFEVRERASDVLFRAGPGGMAALQRAAGWGNPEVRIRAETRLGKISRGVYPDTPADVAELA